MAQGLPGQLISLLSAAAATGAGTTYSFGLDGNNQLPNRWIWEMTSTGSATGLRVDIEGSFDGTNWYQVDTSTTTTNYMRWVVDKPVPYIRANLVTLTGGTTPTVTVKLMGTDT